MRKILLTIIGLALASPAWSSQTAVTEISGIQPSVGALKTQVNAKLGTVESNRQDHETRVAAMESGKETKAVVQASAPADTTVDWYDTDQESGVLILKRHNGTTWLRASSHGVQYASSCASITAGMCVDTDDGKLYYHNGTAVVEVGTGGGGTTYTAGTGIDITSGVISSTVTGTLPPGNEGQGVQRGATAWEAVDLAPLAFTDNVSRNTTTGVVSVPVTNTATSGSAVPLTSGGAYTALAGKENADSTIVKVAEIDTQAEFEALVGWPLPSGGSGTTYTAGTGIDITSGVISSTVTGTLPSGTEGQGLQKGASAWEAVNYATLAFSGKVVRDTETGLVSIVTDSSPTNGSTNFLTSAAIYDALAGKENADSTIVKVAEIDTQAEFEALVGWPLPSGGSGVGGYVTAPVYSDSPCTKGTYSFHATYGVIYCKNDNTWDYQVVSGASLAWASWNNLTPVTHSLTITPSGFTGAAKFTYNSTDYTTEQTITGLSADASFTVTPDTGREIACTGTGLTDNTGGSYTANTDTADVDATCTSN